jgi:hypothetical protein
MKQLYCPPGADAALKGIFIFIPYIVFASPFFFSLLFFVYVYRTINLVFVLFILCVDALVMFWYLDLFLQVVNFWPTNALIECEINHVI